MAWILIGAVYALEVGFVNPYRAVCDLVESKIFLSQDKLEPWVQTCHQRSDWVSPFTQKSLIFKDLNNLFETLQVSHLVLHQPSEVQSIWEGESQDTGIQSEYVDSELMIFKVHPQSPAHMAGLRRGDIIKHINGEHPNPWEAQTTSGHFVIQRQGEQKEFNLYPGTFTRDEKMKLSVLGPSVGFIEVPSFRGIFFQKDELISLQQKMQQLKKIVIDLRGNSGGNFVAGLRFLSLFICEPTVIGQLVQPRSSEEGTGYFDDELDDEKQLAVLGQNKSVVLRTYSSEKCFSGSLKVLVDHNTASVAEMVAQALKEYKKSPIVGNPSRGQLLVGVWYPVPELGMGAQISIPEAIFESRHGHRIEGSGVQLDQVYYYDLHEMQAGIDSWVKKALD